MRDEERELRCRALAEDGQMALVCVDVAGRIVEWSSGAEALLGWTRAEALGKPASMLAPPGREDEIAQQMARAARGEAVDPLETPRLRKDGASFEAIVVLTPVREPSGRLVAIWAAIFDFVSRRRLQRYVAYLERAFAMLDGISAVAARESEPTVVYREACRVAVERAGLLMAWVGRVEPDRMVTPVTSQGHEQGYLTSNTFSTVAEPRGMGPTGRCVRECRPIVCPDIANDPLMAPWRDAALARGYRSSAAFPIMRDDRILAVMGVYAREVGFFTPSSTHLLQAIANVLALSGGSLSPGGAGPHDEHARSVA